MTLDARIARIPIPFDPDRGREAAAFLPLGPVRDLAAGAAGCSPHLAGLLAREAEWASGALPGSPEAARDALLAEAAALEGDPARPLRRIRRRIALLVALGDLGGVWPLEAVTEALTALADRAVSKALGRAVAQETARGRLPEEPGIFVVAMGKMGAGELNYSSDIDLIALLDGARHGPSEHAALRSGAVRAVRAMTRTLAEVGPEGYVFRVDLRLRPDPSVTPVCLPVEAAERYYESLARTWERAAYVKARICAGDLAAGEAFLARLTPFVWRRHLDFAAVEDIRAMARRIEDHRGLGGPIEVPGHDLKRGPGGIRAVEFAAQAHQLLHGGRDPSLRVRGTVDALGRLAAAGRLPEEAAAELAEDYRALREAEHRLQMIRDAQTHAVPTAPAELDRLARLSGEGDTARHLAALRERLVRIRAWSERLMGPPEPAGPRRAIPERWASYPALRSARARDAMERLGGALMARIDAAPRPEEAMAALDRFLEGLPAGAQLFAMFEANPPLMDLIVDVAATAPGLAAYLSRNAAVLDAVVGGRFFAPWPGEAALRDELAAVMARERDHEARLDIARAWAREWHFRVGVHHLRGLLDGDVAGAQYAELASAVLGALLPVVEADLAARHGPAPGRGAMALAMGSLGAGWLHAGSDLDLIVIYDADGVAASDGPRPLAARAWYARLAQGLVTALSAPMARGRLYEVDMRLRPSGRQGPVATALAAFRDYQREEAWTWERLALTRARPVAGATDLMAQVEALRGEVIERSAPPARIAADTADMRRRLAEARPRRDPWDMRAGSGGLQDVELYAQAMALGEGRLDRAVPDQLGHGGPLGEAYALQRRVRAVTALLAPGGFAPGAVGQGGTAMLLRETEAEDPPALLARIEALRLAAAAAIEDGLARMAARG